MTSALLSPWQLALRIGLVSALAGGVGAACCNTVSYVYPKNIQAFALPPGCPTGSQPADTTQLNACLTGIEFDTTESTGDEQRLMVIDSGPGTGLPCAGDSTHTCRYGPLAKVESVKGSEMYSDSALSEGRIIARMYLRAGETESYPKFGLVPGDTTYWWVNTAQDTSYFVHRHGTNPDLATTSRGLEVNPHPSGTYQQAFASWIWDETDERLNGTCGSGCCKP
jgi:hypothetical protein